MPWITIYCWKDVLLIWKIWYQLYCMKFKTKLSLFNLYRWFHNPCFQDSIISKQKMRMGNREFVGFYKAPFLFLGHLSNLPPVGSGTELHSSSLTTQSNHNTTVRAGRHQPARQEQLTTNFNPTSGQFRLTLINASSTFTHHRLSDWISKNMTFI